MTSLRAKRRLTLIVLLFFCASSNSLAQQNTETLVLNVSVTDEMGKSYPGLKPEHFSAWVDKVPRKIVSLNAESKPLSVGFLIDTSGSIGPPDKKEAKQFWRNMADGGRVFER